MDNSLEYFKQLFTGIYDLMKDVDIKTLGAEFTLWDLFIWGMLGGVIVVFIRKITGND